MRVLGIDPGYQQSAWLYLSDAGLPQEFGISANDDVLHRLRQFATWRMGMIGPPPDAIVIEQVASFGMAVGAEVFETVFWSGRFAEAARPVPVHRLPRMQVKMHLCHHPRAKDANIRQALIDLYGGPEAKGTKRVPGPLFGISKDVWSALAVARTFYDAQQ